MSLIGEIEKAARDGWDTTDGERVNGVVIVASDDALKIVAALRAAEAVHPHHHEGIKAFAILRDALAALEGEE
jgi:hypothetical protein